MTTMIREVYEALKEAGASEEKAAAAAAALAGYENQFQALHGRMQELEGDVRLLKWMVGFNLAATLGVLLKLLL